MGYIRIIILLLCLTTSLQASINVLSYNVENFFDPIHDSLKNDEEFTPDGTHHWTWTRYWTKVNHIAQVITNAGQWEGFHIVGLMEVENDSCLIALCHRLNNRYGFIHYESADVRGIDVALLYDKQHVSILDSYPIKVPLEDYTTRDILYAKTLIERDTFHFFVCHLPSQLGGAEAVVRREKAKKVLMRYVHTIHRINNKGKILIFGDMNSTPTDDLPGMHNLLVQQPPEYGTYKYQGEWNSLDQVYYSSQLWKKVSYEIYMPSWLLEEDSRFMGMKPKRTFVGYHYNGGYSDHLPLIIHISHGR